MTQTTTAQPPAGQSVSANNIAVVCQHQDYLEQATWVCQQLGLDLCESLDSIPQQVSQVLVFGPQGSYLLASASEIKVDLHQGSSAHRRKQGGGKGQMIAKAVGFKDAPSPPSVFDATAGLGGDAFVLACLGCQVEMMERSPVAFSLLKDGLDRARFFAQDHDSDLLEILGLLNLSYGNSIDKIESSAAPLAEVIYLDPMFPERTKSAAVKKGMQAFHQLIGFDLDESELLKAALAKAEYRVVVKRPRKSPCIEGPAPSLKLEGKSSRYDIYVKKSFKHKQP